MQFELSQPPQRLTVPIAAGKQKYHEKSLAGQFAALIF